MTTFNAQKEWMAFVTGKKFIRSDNAALYQFFKPVLNKGFNLKIVWRGKEVNTNAEFHTMGGAIMKIDEDMFALKGFVMAGDESSATGKDVIYTVLKGEEVQFTRL